MQRLLAIAALAACALVAAAEDDAAASGPAYVTLGPADIVNGALVDSPESWIVALADPQASGDSDSKLDIVKEAAATLGGCVPAVAAPASDHRRPHPPLLPQVRRPHGRGRLHRRRARLGGDPQVPQGLGRQVCQKPPAGRVRGRATATSTVPV